MASVFNLTILAFGILGIITGYRRSFTGQICSILGFAFGAVCAHTFSEPSEEFMRNALPVFENHICSGFVYSLLGSALVYTLVYLLFRCLTGILRSAMSVLHLGVLNRMLGAAFGLFKYLLALSIFFNLIVCVSPGSSLVKSYRADDGNLIELVLSLAPEVLGSLSMSEYAHYLQLQEARKISELRIEVEEGMIQQRVGGYC